MFSSGRLTWLCVLAMAASIGCGPLFGEYGSFHYAQLGLAGLVLIGLVGWRERLAAPLSRGTWFAFLGMSLVWLEATSASQFLSFDVNSVDFSIFDWMIENTRRGQWGQVPIFWVNHFGVHSSFLILVFVPLYAVVASPWWLVLSGPVFLWSGLFPLRRLVERAAPGHGALLLLASLAWLATPWTGRLVMQGFRVEHLPLAFILWFLVGWLERRPGIWAPALLALFCSKEDSALMLGAFAGAHFVFERNRWREAAVVLAACLVFLALYSRLQFALIAGGPGYRGMWTQFGNTPSAAVLGMLSHPLEFVARLGTSGIWAFFGPLAFLPFLHWRSAAGLAPHTVLFGAASYELMHGFRDYYPAVLVPMAVFGVLEVVRTWRFALPVALLAFSLFTVIGYGYASVRNWSPQRYRDVAEVREQVANAPRICAQGAVAPHLGYPRELIPLTNLDCGDDPASWIVVAPGLNPAPFSASEFDAAVARWSAQRPARHIGIFTILEPPR